MGPWGYVLAKDRAGAEALAVVKYQGRPTYHAIIIAPAGTGLPQLPGRCARPLHLLRRCRLHLRLADPAQLVPHARHRPADLLPVPRRRLAPGQRHGGGERAGGPRDRLRPQPRRHDRGGPRAGGPGTVVWRSDPLPNDALAVRRGLDAAAQARYAGRRAGDRRGERRARHAAELHGLGGGGGQRPTP